MKTKLNLIGQISKDALITGSINNLLVEQAKKVKRKHIGNIISQTTTTIPGKQANKFRGESLDTFIVTTVFELDVDIKKYLTTLIADTLDIFHNHQNLRIVKKEDGGLYVYCSYWRDNGKQLISNSTVGMLEIVIPDNSDEILINDEVFFKIAKVFDKHPMLVQI